MTVEFEGDGHIDEELNKCEAETNKTEGKERNFIKLEEGEAGNKVRILPPFKGQKAPWFHAKVHFGLMGSSGKPMPVLCSMDQFGSCPLCTEAAAARECGDNLKSWQMAAKDYFLYNVLDLNGAFGVLSADKKLQQELIKTFKFTRSEDGGVYSPWNITEGSSLKIVKTKGPKKGNQKFAPNVYSVHPLARKPVGATYIEMMGDSMTKLDEIYRVFKPVEIQGMVDGTYDPYAKDEDGEKAVEKPTEKPVAKAKSTPPPAATPPAKAKAPAPKPAPQPAPAAQEVDDVDAAVADAEDFVNNVNADDVEF